MGVFYTLAIDFLFKTVSQIGGEWREAAPQRFPMSAFPKPRQQCRNRCYPLGRKRGKQHVFHFDPNVGPVTGKPFTIDPWPFGVYGCKWTAMRKTHTVQDTYSLVPNCIYSTHF
jgi:hypothetical protein